MANVKGGVVGPVGHVHGGAHRGAYETAPIQVPGADAVALAARAVARTRFTELGFIDVRAEAMLMQLDLDPFAFGEERLRSSLARTMEIDDVAREFFERHPHGLGIGFFSGLCTRFSRIDNGLLRWIDVEVPGVAQFLADTQCADPHHLITACCGVACNAWMRRLAQIPTLVAVQGGFVGAPRSAIETFFVNVSRACDAGVEIVCDFDERAPLRARPSGVLELLTEEGSWARFPRLRFVRAAGSLAHLRVHA
ncbi:MAG: hypothetical protein KIT84_37855 [Labilithrix sp.]|nr:hypothetical protein [Labilithrix sp.]MCW5816823.1 hypothetical protein [Labilithrix sp.]